MEQETKADRFNRIISNMQAQIDADATKAADVPYVKSVDIADDELTARVTVDSNGVLYVAGITVDEQGKVAVDEFSLAQFKTLNMFEKAFKLIFSGNGGKQEVDTDTAQVYLQDGSQKSLRTFLTDIAAAQPTANVLDFGNGFKTVKTAKGRVWIGRYSNNFRDSDVHAPFGAEILAGISHKSFVERVNSGEIPMPELWLGHNEKLKFGKASRLAWHEDEDGRGIAMGIGLIDETPAAHKAADELEKSSKPLLMSHGFSAVRDPNNPSIFTEYVTHELSVLSGEKAANKLTSFGVSKMNQTEKNQFAESVGIDPSAIDGLLESNTAVFEAAKDADLEFSKEKKGEAIEAPATETTDDIRQEVAEALAEAVTPLVEMVGKMSKQLAAVQAEVETLKVADTEKAAAIAAEMPKASVSSLLLERLKGVSAMDSGEGKIDGRTKEALDAPKETKRETVKTGYLQYVTGVK